MKPAAPCLLINYARPEKTAAALANLRWADPLYLFCDGPRTNGIREKNQEVRSQLELEAVAREKAGLKTKTLFLDANRGPKHGPLTAIRWFFENEPAGHVIEDDILVCPEFAEFHTEALAAHKESGWLWIAEGHPLPDCPHRIIGTKMARLVAWSSWAEKVLPALDAIEKKPSPWKRAGCSLTKGLHPKTQIFLWKEFGKLERNPNWSWHYPLLQYQLEMGLLGGTPSARLHHNTGVDGSGYNCINLFGEEEKWAEENTRTALRKTSVGAHAPSEKKMEVERYGRIHQAIGRKLFRLTPRKWRRIWKPVLA